MAVNVDIGYATALKHWGLGCALFKPIPAASLNIGYLGYLTPQGWVKLLDLSKPEDIRANGLKPFGFDLTPHPDPEFHNLSVWNSHSMIGKRMKLDAGITAPIDALKLHLTAGASFSSSEDNAAILFTTAPVTKEFWVADEEVKTWMKENKTQLVLSFPNCLKYGLVIVTSVWKTSKANTYWVGSKNTNVNFVFGGDVQDIAHLDVRAEWYSWREDTGSLGTCGPGEHVFAFDGQPYLWDNKVTAAVKKLIFRSRKPKAVKDPLEWLIQHVPTVQSKGSDRARFFGGLQPDLRLEDLVPNMGVIGSQSWYPRLDFDTDASLLKFDAAPPDLQGGALELYKRRFKASDQLLPVINGKEYDNGLFAMFDDEEKPDEDPWLLQLELTEGENLLTALQNLQSDSQTQPEASS